MIRDELLNPLIVIQDACEGLMDESAGLLTVHQERVVSSIAEVNRELYDMLISLPDVDNAGVQGLLSYETRSHLTSIIGYAEILLDESEESLTPLQEQYAQAIHDHGAHLLALVTELLDNST